VNAIEPKDIANTRVSLPSPGPMAKDEAAMFEHQEKMQDAQLGWVGRIWGSRFEKPGNISAIVAIALVLYLGILIFTDSDNPKFDDVFSGISTIVTLILGYLFGSSASRDNKS